MVNETGNSNLNRWDDLVAHLSAADWSSSDSALLDQIGPILEKVSKNHGVVRERIDRLLNCPDEYDKLRLNHLYPRILVERLELYADPADRFRIRMHRFNSAYNTGGAKEKIHNHKFPGFTLVLKGAYEEEFFDYSDVDLTAGTCKVWCTGKTTLSIGSINAKGRMSAHRVRNVSEHESCYTLFIRGPIRSKYGLMFDETRQTCWQWLGASDALRKGFQVFRDMSDEYM